MSAPLVDVRELIAWDLDEYAFRDTAVAGDEQGFFDKAMQAKLRLAQCRTCACSSALVEGETQVAQALLDREDSVTDMQEEYRGLDWGLGVVDLRRVLAFQRRLVFRPEHEARAVPGQADWAGLMAFALGARRSTEYRVTKSCGVQGRVDIRLMSGNPDLQIRVVADAWGSGAPLPLALHGGSPNLEVAELQGRWFLRDGYHRAYRLLREGVYRVPAVVIRARTIEELGATGTWFFHESQLFSDRPPHVADFLDDEMNFCYKRIALRKEIRIRIEESLEPFSEFDERERGNR